MFEDLTDNDSICYRLLKIMIEFLTGFTKKSNGPPLRRCFDVSLLSIVILNFGVWMNFSYSNNISYILIYNIYI